MSENKERLKILALGNSPTKNMIAVLANKLSDGGGVKGLSSLLILERIMARVGAKMKRPDLQPYQYFDIIGGTSTGGSVLLGIEPFQSFYYKPKVFRLTLPELLPLC